jgi:long-chain fatty acid transport protein
VTFNILAPGVITTHYTVGGTYALSSATELTMSYMYAPSNSVSGASNFGGTDTIKMSQQALGIQFGWRW